ncbi:MAG: helix-turn-helix domain-containing protein [Nitrosotalea sp.]
MDDIQKELNIIKKLLIIQLVKQGIPIENIVKATGMSTKTLYEFIPKNIKQSKSKE